MRRVLPLLCVLTLLAPAAARAQGAQAAPDPIDGILRRVEAALDAGDRAAFSALFEVRPVLLQGYIADLFVPGAIRSIVRERDRAPMEAVPPGEGFRVVVEFFVETPGHARLLTAGLDIRRPPGGDAASWRIINAEGMTSVDGIYKLRLKPGVQYSARNFEVRAEDLTLSLPEGNVVAIECDDGVTGLILIGRGEMRFSPAPAAERGQLRLFAGSDAMTTAFDHAFVRMNSGDYAKVVSAGGLTEVPAEPRLTRRAQEVFDDEAAKSYNIDLREYSRDDWYLMPPIGDFLAEIDTRRFGSLTYSRSDSQAEDITLFQRDKRRTIALYSSLGKIAARGRFFSDDLLREYDVADYDVDASIIPSRQWVQARVRVSIRTRASMSTLMLRLADSLAVSSITSLEYGRLLHLRLRNQNLVLVNLGRTVPPDTDITLIVNYGGRVAPQSLETESIQAGAQEPTQIEPPATSPVSPVEPNYMLSNRSFWYPQNPVPDYATATLRLGVPDGFTCIASGQPLANDPVVSLRDIINLPEGAHVFNFRANQPLRYLSFVVSRFAQVTDRTITLGDDGAGPGAPKLEFRVQATPRQQGRARQVSRPAEDILRFYTSVMNDSPFPSITVALVESELPGGHSPGFFAVVNEPLPAAANIANWRADPAFFEGFPEFFLAHELAHQWWGQAIGWKSYHDQWLSEGFAQYFAALYAQKTRGEKTFTDMLRQFRRWTLSDSDQGPVYLGYRLGHIKNESRVYRAVVYNKGAGVLHMLRRMLGDQVFFSGLRRFYEDRKFEKASTDDLRRALEAESGRTLDRFFERWIYGSEVPRVTWRSTIGERGVTLRFEQQGTLVFDLPVTVTLTYADGRTRETVVTLAEQQVERTIPADGVVRQVQVNRDNAALAEFDQR